MSLDDRFHESCHFGGIHPGLLDSYIGPVSPKEAGWKSWHWHPVHTAIKLILDNHSAHISRETRAWIAQQPAHRFEFTFTPTHGSWLNLIEGFFSKLARSVLRHIRVASKQELKDRIMAAMDFFNQKPVVHTWTYKLDRAV
jgi:transposase